MPVSPVATLKYAKFDVGPLTILLQYQCLKLPQHQQVSMQRMNLTTSAACKYTEQLQ
jgi:hypothetical protein